jgi:hypothetical protein
MFVDPGDDVLAALDHELAQEGASMRVERFRTSLDEPAALIVADTGQGVRIESQPDGFGMIWPTELDVVSVVERALSVLPEPKPGDEAIMTSDETFQKTLPVSALLGALATETETGQVSLVQLDIGPAALVWAQNSNGNGPPSRRVSFGDDYYVREKVGALLSRTAYLPGELALSEVLDAADETLGPQHFPPA